jgi:hypothetical protein
LTHRREVSDGVQFGVDTFKAHLDSHALPPAGSGDVRTAIMTGGRFFVWNGNSRPLFAGRNFLFGDFIWGRAEATSASADEVDRRYPPPPGPNGTPLGSPEHPEFLSLLVDRVAPIQAPNSTRQGLTDDRGYIAGAVDADAICRRINACVQTGEFLTSEAHVMQVWLSVDPNHPFSSEYWAGWADGVNNAFLQILPGETLGQSQPFRAGIIHSYVAGADGKLRPDPNVTAALAVRHRGLDTSIHGRWADFQLWPNAPADLVANGSPLLDWTRFDPPTAPILWRVAGGFSPAGGAAADVPVSIDAANPQAEPLAFMFRTQKWQPNVPTILNYGFINKNPVTAASIPNIQANPIPDMRDSGGAAAGHFELPGGTVAVIGRYIWAGGGGIAHQEAQDLSEADFQLFTIWEGARNVPGLGPSEPHEIDTSNAGAPQMNNWGEFTPNIHKYIFYFKRPDPDNNPATLNAGELDGHDAFQYCHDVLHQPSHTPVFFAIDFDPYDLPNPHGIAGNNDPAAPAATAAVPHPTHGWPANPAQAVFEGWLRAYFKKIGEARDALFAGGGPYYLIGVYAPGKTLQLLYEQGVVTYFWQPLSSGRNGSHPPLWPWFHANRWQFHSETGLTNAGWAIGGVEIVNGADPDVDWGDGGTWNLSTSLAQAERSGFSLHFIDWGELVVPPPPPPPP